MSRRDGWWGLTCVAGRRAIFDMSVPETLIVRRAARGTSIAQTIASAGPRYGRVQMTKLTSYRQLVPTLFALGWLGCTSPQPPGDEIGAAGGSPGFGATGWPGWIRQRRRWRVAGLRSEHVRDPQGSGPRRVRAASLAASPASADVGLVVPNSRPSWAPPTRSRRRRPRSRAARCWCWRMARRPSPPTPTATPSTSWTFRPAPSPRPSTCSRAISRADWSRMRLGASMSRFARAARSRRAIPQPGRLSRAGRSAPRRAAWPTRPAPIAFTSPATTASWSACRPPAATRFAACSSMTTCATCWSTETPCWSPGFARRSC